MSSIVISGDTSGSVTLQAPTVAGSTVVTLPTTSMNIGTGGGSVATNTAFGAGALNANTSGSNNVAVGQNCMALNTTGANNTAIGRDASYGNTTGTNNTALGYRALDGNTASSNTGIGADALRSNTTASNNTAVGYQAGYTNATGIGNVFVGRAAGYTSNGSGNAYNTIVGDSAGYSLTTGTSNTFIGSSATANSSGYFVTTGSKNTIIGGYSGNQGSLDIRTASNHIVLSDGDGNPRFYINNDAQSFSSCSVGDFIQKWSLGTTSTDGLIVTYPTVTPNNTSRFFFRGSDSTNTKIDIYSSGTISNRTGTYNTLSDAKLKENIVDATPKLNKLMDVKVRNYNLIGDELKQIGFVAQELEQVFPNLIDNVPDFDENREPTGEVTKGVKLTVMIPILVKAIQEQQALITSLTTRITALEAKVGA